MALIASSRPALAQLTCNYREGVPNGHSPTSSQNLRGQSQHMGKFERDFEPVRAFQVKATSALTCR